MTEKGAKRGDLFELKAALNSDKREKRKEALKKVISFMTVGKDVSTLFNDVLNCLQSDKMDIKKLVYLYLMNYARVRPQMAIMVVNRFVRDSEDQNPLIRALAIRTMGCIRLESIAEHLVIPLNKCLTDEDPYVRKTAAICVAKLYSVNPATVIDNDFLGILKQMLSDSNSMVIANTVAALSEIAESHEDPRKVLDFTPSIVNKLLTALGECTEWGQIYILDALTYYAPAGPSETKNVCDRVLSRLSHNNAGVVLSAIKVLLNMIQYLSSDDIYVLNLLNKMSAPLVTLITFEPEIQYVALRNIVIIVQKYPHLLRNDIKAFFIKYNDPIYIKLEKLGILNRLVCVDNVSLVLSELREYANEVDVDFVKRAIRSIGFCALRVDVASDSCVKLLIDLMSTKVSYVVQESVIVIKDILRRYPNRYESVIEKLSECLNSLDEPEARAAMVWILGEYGDRIDGVAGVLKTFVDNILDEATIVQLQLLTAVVKLFLKNPSEHQELVQQILTIYTQQCGNPDVRDRGYIYWRLLSSDPNSAKSIVLADKPIISEETTNLETSLLDELIANLTTLASVYHKTPHSFIQGHAGLRYAFGIKGFESTATSSFYEPDGTSKMTVTASGQIDMALGEDLLLDLSEQIVETGYIPNVEQPPSDFSQLGSKLQELNLLDANNHTNTQTGTMSSQGFRIVPEAAHLYAREKMIYLTSNAGKGLQIVGSMSIRSGILFLDCTMSNMSMVSMNDFSMCINKNPLGIAVSPGGVLPNVIPPNGHANISFPLNFSGPLSQTGLLNELELAFINNIDTFCFTITLPFNLCLQNAPTTQITAETFPRVWEAFQSSVMSTEVLWRKGMDYLITLLTSNFFFFCGFSSINNRNEGRLFGITRNNIGFLVKVVETANSSVLVTASCANSQIVPFLIEILKEIMLSV